MNSQSVLSARSLWSRLWRSWQWKLKSVHLKLIDPSGQLPICSFQRSSLLESLSVPHRSDEYSWNKLVSQVRKKVVRTWTSPREENGCCYEKFKCTNKSELEINKQNNREHRKPTCPPKPCRVCLLTLFAVAYLHWAVTGSQHTQSLNGDNCVLFIWSSVRARTSPFSGENGREGWENALSQKASTANAPEALDKLEGRDVSVAHKSQAGRQTSLHGSRGSVSEWKCERLNV